MPHTLIALAAIIIGSTSIIGAVYYYAPNIEARWGKKTPTT